MAVRALPFITQEEYLEAERKSDTKHEYVSGQIFAMAGASKEHNVITADLARELGNQLEDGPCEVFASDLRTKIEATGMYTYPDVIVVCGGARFEDEHFDTLVNPTVVFEILSPSTSAYDRGQKAEHYRRLETLQAYVLLEQDRPHVEWYTREPGGGWRFYEADGKDAYAQIEPINCRLPLARIYRRIPYGAPANTDSTAA